MNNDKHIEKYRDFLRGESKIKSEMTIYNYILGVKYFLSYIDKDAEDITTEDIRKYKTHMTTKQIKNKKTRGYSNNALIVRYASIKKFFEYLEKPLDKKILSFPDRTEIIKIPLTEEDIQRLFEASKENKRNHSILKILYYTGLRKFEVVNLNVGDINTKEEILYVYGGKGNSNKIINIHREAIDSIVEYMEVREPRNPSEEALFLNQDGYRLGRASIQTIVKKYASKAGITKRIYPHLFRVSLATHMSENGCSLEEIRRQTRHKGYEVLKGYIQMSPKHLKEAYEKGISLTKQPPQDTIHQPEIKPEIQDTPIPKQETQTPRQETKDNTDKYIQLLKDGLIDKQDFLKLISGNKMETDRYIY
jgi:integrase/recombinase XerD